MANDFSSYPCCGANPASNNGHSDYCHTRTMSDPIQPYVPSLEEEQQVEVQAQIDERESNSHIMSHMRVKFEVEIELDWVPGRFHKAEDFIELIQAQIPDYYLKSVRQVA